MDHDRDTLTTDSGQIPTTPIRTSGHSRRDFLRVGAGVLAGVTLAACDKASSSSTSSPSNKLTASTTARFHSRPDLTPPLIEVRRGAGTPGQGLICVTPGGPILVDNAGQPVWVHPVPHAATNLRVQRYQDRPVLTWWQGEVTHYGVGQSGEYVVTDESYRQLMTVEARHGLSADLHEFIIDHSGVAYFTAYRHYITDLTRVGGPKHGTALDATVQGVDLATGDLVFDWRSAQHIAFSESYQKYSSQYPYDPVHLNSIDFTPDGKLLLSARNTWCVYKVDPVTGEILWRLGGKKSDFDLGARVRFAWQHDARTHADGTISVFDDEGDPPEAKQSRGLVLAVDDGARVVSERTQYFHPGKHLLAGSQGSTQYLPGGDVFIGWGAEPYYTEFQQDGTLVLDGRFSTGSSYRAFRFGWTGTPTDQPTVATTSKNGQTTLYASWNGSTETARWQLLAATPTGNLQPVAGVVSSGFETALPVPPGATTVAVAALDSTGKELSRSAIVSL